MTVVTPAPSAGLPSSAGVSGVSAGHHGAHIPRPRALLPALVRVRGKVVSPRAIRRALWPRSLAGVLAVPARSRAGLRRRPRPADEGQAVSIVSIAAGVYAGYAVLSDGHVLAWGDDLEGQIGDTGPWSSRPVPVEVDGLAAAILVAGSGNSSFALRRDGTVWAWGDDSQGELANEQFTARQTPWPRAEADRRQRYRCRSFLRLRDPRRRNSVGVGRQQLRTARNGFGRSRSPRFRREIARLTDVVAVAAGTSTATRSSDDGTVWAGATTASNSSGAQECGPTPTGHPEACRASNVPHQFPGLTGSWRSPAGGDSGYALRRDGTVWAWGDDEFGELGDGVRTLDQGRPVRVKGLDHVVAIAAGSCSAYALLKNGTVWAWGRGDYGQLGNGSNSDRSLPVQVKGLADIVQVVGGGDMAFALERDGSLWSWGANTLGQLGDGSVAGRNVPVRVLGLPGSPPPKKAIGAVLTPPVPPGTVGPARWRAVILARNAARRPTGAGRSLPAGSPCLPTSSRRPADPFLPVSSAAGTPTAFSSTSRSCAPRTRRPTCDPSPSRRPISSDSSSGPDRT